MPKLSFVVVLRAVCILFLLSDFSAASFGDVPLRNWPVLSKGEPVDANVRAVQLLLTAHGYPVAADGLFGRATQRVLCRFQQANGLVAKGETNNPTWEALVVTIHQGSKGPAVQAAQIELRDAGYAVPVDGIFDVRMATVVRKYQKLTGHSADGVVGRKTWYELIGGDDQAGD